MQTRLVNLTGHEVYELETGTKIPASPYVLRTCCVTVELPPINGIKTCHSNEHILYNELPRPVEGVVYIVSALALNAIPEDRTDFVCPRQVVRNKDGGIIGCKGFRCR